MSRRALGPSWGLVALLAFACDRLEHGLRAHTCALLQDGAVWCWGYNDRGQLGDGSAYDRPRPVAVVGLPAARSVSAGLGFTCAATLSGEAWCWGRNDVGQLGDDGPPDDRRTPAPVRGIAGVTRVLAALGSACAIADAGEVWCWGRTSTVVRRVPERVTGLPAPAIDAVFVDADAPWCALLGDGTVWCWGEDHVASDTGLGSVAAIGSGGEMPEAVCAVFHDGSTTCGTFPRPAVAVSGGCALLDDGVVWCSGAAGPMFEGVVAFDAGVMVEFFGGHHACAVLASGQVSCSGPNDSGQLGDGNESTGGTALVVGLPGPASDVTASPTVGTRPQACL